jgi:hypothetical protein
MVFDLPVTLEVGGIEWDIETDYRQILRILAAYEDPDLSDNEKVAICLYNLYVDFETMPPELYKDAYDAAMEFIDNGNKNESAGARVMDWTQDAPLIFPAVNKSAGFEVRSVKYMHWWTFLGYFMEIKDTVYSTVLSIRQKKKRGKKLEKWESEYWTSNKAICEIKPRYTEEELAEIERMNKLLG